MKSQRLLETRSVVIEALKNLAKEMKATVYLFGSYARGDYTLESDVDVIVVCDCFENMDYVDRVVAVRTKLPRNIGFDIIALTPNEFKNRLNTPFYRDASRQWIEIKP